MKSLDKKTNFPFITLKKTTVVVTNNKASSATAVPTQRSASKQTPPSRQSARRLNSRLVSYRIRTYRTRQSASVLVVKGAHRKFKYLQFRQTAQLNRSAELHRISARDVPAHTRMLCNRRPWVRVLRLQQAAVVRKAAAPSLYRRYKQLWTYGYGRRLASRRISIKSRLFLAAGARLVGARHHAALQRAPRSRYTRRVQETDSPRVRWFVKRARRQFRQLRTRGFARRLLSSPLRWAGIRSRLYSRVQRRRLRRQLIGLGGPRPKRRRRTRNRIWSWRAKRLVHRNLGWLQRIRVGATKPLPRSGQPLYGMLAGYSGVRVSLRARVALLPRLQDRNFLRVLGPARGRRWNRRCAVALARKLRLLRPPHRRAARATASLMVRLRRSRAILSHREETAPLKRDLVRVLFKSSGFRRRIRRSIRRIAATPGSVLGMSAPQLQANTSRVLRRFVRRTHLRRAYHTPLRREATQRLLVRSVRGMHRRICRILRNQNRLRIRVKRLRAYLRALARKLWITRTRKLPRKWKLSKLRKLSKGLKKSKSRKKTKLPKKLSKRRRAQRARYLTFLAAARRLHGRKGFAEFTQLIQKQGVFLRVRRCIRRIQRKLRRLAVNARLFRLAGRRLRALQLVLSVRSPQPGLSQVRRLRLSGRMQLFTVHLHRTLRRTSVRPKAVTQSIYSGARLPVSGWPSRLRAVSVAQLQRSQLLAAKLLLRERSTPILQRRKSASSLTPTLRLMLTPRVALNLPARTRQTSVLALKHSGIGVLIRQPTQMAGATVSLDAYRYKTLAHLAQELCRGEATPALKSEPAYVHSQTSGAAISFSLRGVLSVRSPKRALMPRGDIARYLKGLAGASIKARTAWRVHKTRTIYARHARLLRKIRRRAGTFTRGRAAPGLPTTHQHHRTLANIQLNLRLRGGHRPLCRRYYRRAPAWHFTARTFHRLKRAGVFAYRHRLLRRWQQQQYKRIRFHARKFAHRAILIRRKNLVRRQSRKARLFVHKHACRGRASKFVRRWRTVLRKRKRVRRRLLLQKLHRLYALGATPTRYFRLQPRKRSARRRSARRLRVQRLRRRLAIQRSIRHRRLRRLLVGAITTRNRHRLPSAPVTFRARRRLRYLRRSRAIRRRLAMLRAEHFAKALRITLKLALMKHQARSRARALIGPELCVRRRLKRFATTLRPVRRRRKRVRRAAASPKASARSVLSVEGYEPDVATSEQKLLLTLGAQQPVDAARKILRGSTARLAERLRALRARTIRSTGAALTRRMIYRLMKIQLLRREIKRRRSRKKKASVLKWRLIRKQRRRNRVPVVRSRVVTLFRWQVARRKRLTRLARRFFSCKRFGRKHKGRPARFGRKPKRKWLRYRQVRRHKRFRKRTTYQARKLFWRNPRKHATRWRKGRRWAAPASARRCLPRLVQKQARAALRRPVLAPWHRTYLARQLRKTLRSATHWRRCNKRAKRAALRRRLQRWRKTPAQRWRQLRAQKRRKAISRRRWHKPHNKVRRQPQNAVRAARWSKGRARRWAWVLKHYFRKKALRRRGYARNRRRGHKPRLARKYSSALPRFLRKQVRCRIRRRLWAACTRRRKARRLYRSIARRSGLLKIRRAVNGRRRKPKTLPTVNGRRLPRMSLPLHKKDVITRRAVQSRRWKTLRGSKILQVYRRRRRLRHKKSNENLPWGRLGRRERTWRRNRIKLFVHAKKLHRREATDRLFGQQLRRNLARFKRPPAAWRVVRWSGKYRDKQKTRLRLLHRAPGRRLVAFARAVRQASALHRRDLLIAQASRPCSDVVLRLYCHPHGRLKIRWYDGEHVISVNPI